MGATEPTHSFTLQQYMGKWYEVARLPNVYQQNCQQNTIVQYKINAKGQIVVDNQCLQSNGKIKQSGATAWVPKPAEPGAWQFSFVQLFDKPILWVPYWVLDVKPDRYAIVGQPNRQFGWVLARKPKLDKADWLLVKQTLVKQGYNPCQFNLYPQTSGAQTSVISLCKVLI